MVHKIIENLVGLLWIQQGQIILLILFFLLVEAVFLRYQNSSLSVILSATRTNFWDIGSFLISIFGFRGLIVNVFYIFFPYLISIRVPRFEYALTVNNEVLKVMLAYILYDFISYWKHRFNHAFSWTWEGHSFHHSATKLSMFSDFRSHPLQDFFGTLFMIVVPKLVFNLSGVSFVIYTALIIAFGLFTHGRIDFNFGLIGRYIFVTPRFHHLHHSIANTQHKNFGDTLVFWDLLFGTYAAPNISIQQINTGIQNNYFEYNSILRGYFRPISFCFRSLIRAFSARFIFRKKNEP